MLLSLYHRLLKEHGPQGWWPAHSPFEVMAGAVLTQNTNWRNVERAIANLKGARLLEPHRLLQARKKNLEQLIRPSGFYRQKAERLRLATEKWLEHRNAPPDTPAFREEWLSVKGIGKETADSILLYAFNRPVFVVDAYTRRFCSRHGLLENGDYEDYRRLFESGLPRSAPLYAEYHALIVKWGKLSRKGP